MRTVEWNQLGAKAHIRLAGPKGSQRFMNGNRVVIYGSQDKHAAHMFLSHRIKDKYVR